MSALVTPPLSRKEIKKLANNLRKQLKCNDCYLDIVSIVELVIPIIDNDFIYDYVSSEELSPGMYAYYDPTENTMKILSSVYEGACNDNGRDRFTVAHEVAHYILHQTGYSFARSTQKIPAYCDPEWQANVFASELLMPSNQIINMSINEIVNKCKVSYQAAEIALKNAKKSNC